MENAICSDPTAGTKGNTKRRYVRLHAWPGYGAELAEIDGSKDGHRSSSNTCACRPGLRAAACSGKADVSVCGWHIHLM